MKSKVLLVALGMFSLVACTKEAVNAPAGDSGAPVIPASSVPDNVVAALNTSFSGATEQEWRYSNGDQYACQFNYDDQRHEATYDDSGHQSSHSLICMEAPVPAVVLDAFRAGFPGDTVYEWKLTNDGNWKAHFMRGIVKWEATYNDAGTLLKVEND